MDINEIMNRAKAAQARATASLHEMEEKSEELAASSSPKSPAPPQDSADREAEQQAANAQRQVEILGQLFDTQTMAQMAANQEQLQQMMEQRVAEAASASTEAVMNQLFGEDMGVLAAALETLSLEAECEGFGLDSENEDNDVLYTLLDETMARLETLPEPASAEYGRDTALWGQFGILLSGIVSTLNDHSLDGLDVEEHVPVLEQQVLSLVRRSWGIDGRGALLETIRYLSQGGYTERYRFYCEAESPEELMTGEEDSDEREDVVRAWEFAQHYKQQYSPAFMTGWDVGRAAMLARWGSYLGWITPEEARGILWDLAQRATQDLGG
ncbi:DUF1266 domain-containing protein [Candidatus Allofournierella merdipullorum]|uniref:DUF1266 domain-containing protein n=1 Tax=Candidatus Allofournierella merdipullorum TaxID=2838595 RepID=UPI003AB1FEE3